ncbi:unannotated protein [freshwater metagenome]|uniref:Unannotated protein n=1 Tax=freshwater metagenome TaxID=449393 RepID=A0A6J6X315_9ZZZZ
MAISTRLKAATTDKNFFIISPFHIEFYSKAPSGRPYPDVGNLGDSLLVKHVTRGALMEGIVKYSLLLVSLLKG